MKVWTYAYLAVGLLLLAAPAGAQIPDIIDISTSSEWLTAGGDNAATITVQVANSTSGNTSFEGVAVDFAANSTFGSISPAHAVTGPDGKATAVFKPGTVAGDAPITVTVLYRDGETELVREETFLQRIDHATPNTIANLSYKSEVTVGGTTDITVQMVDRYGNVVDSRRVAENVTFMVGSPAGFVVGESCLDEITVPVDAAGNATVTLRVDTAAGENLVYVRPPAPVKSDYISVTGVADGVPFGITCTVNPSGASVPADGDKVITFAYTLYDEHKNPVSGQGLWVNASVKRGDRPEERQSSLLYSNVHGQVMVTYGPEDSVGVATITATAAANASVSVSQEVEFTSTDPVNMLLTASPQSMPSGDVKSDVVSELRAKVMDVKGNPVEGQTVTFKIVSNSSAPYNQTVDQRLAATSATTNADGYAIVKFSPGNFTTDKKAPGWSDSATGNATVRATWNDTARDIVLTWKNYPYLSVETNVSPETVAVNETVDVTIRLRGDGYAMYPDPIDVVLVIDRSGSMSTIDKNETKTRMALAKDAASTFIGQMDPDRDRVGLVSFSTSTTVNNPLGDSFEAVTGKLNNLDANGATQLRRGIYEAILMQKNQEQSGAVKAVVVMTDGDWNYDGSPIGHGIGYPENSSDAYEFSGRTLEPDHYRYYNGLGGTLERKNWWDYWKCTDGEFTNQNMSRFASDSGVKLYTITFAYKPGEVVNDTMRILATSTGGFYEHAPSGDQLTEIYKRIAGELKTEAGVDTRMDVAFERVNVTGVGLLSGTEVFEYVYENGASTYIHNQTGTEVHFDGTINQTPDWNRDQKLHFDIGTMRLNQVWETTFRLKVKKDGNINIFGPGSTITFNNSADTLKPSETLTLPDTFITALPELNNTGVTSAWLEVKLDEPVPPTGQVAFHDTVPLTWEIAYNGTKDIDEALAYSNDNGRSWTVFWTKTVDRSTTHGQAQMDVRNLPAGEYRVRLVASALDTPEAMDTTVAPVRIGDASRAYIKIE